MSLNVISLSPLPPSLNSQVAGADRYYQVARCFRDEDLRADRQPEFTQLDIEMSFTNMDGILDLGEDLMCAAFREGAGVELPRPFRRMTYAEAMSKYGCDKPDLRYGLEMAELSDVVAGRGLHSSTFQLNLSRFGHTSPCPPV